MSECSHEKQYCWCEADSWAFREGERLRAALGTIAEWARPQGPAGREPQDYERVLRRIREIALAAEKRAES